MPRLKQVGIDIDVNRAIESQRKSFAETENDILRRVLLIDGRSPIRDSALSSQGGATQARANGNWSVRLNGISIPAPNLRAAYKALLLTLANEHPKFLSELATERSRSRRLVARRPEDLYENAPHLASDHAKPLTGGWFYDSNLSTEQVAKRARTAARLCGLRYGPDVSILRDLKEI